MFSHVSNESFLPEETFFAGFSMGAGLSILAGGRLPFSLGGIVAMSGFVKYSELFVSNITKESLNTPILIIQGARDKIVTPDKAEKTVQLLSDLGYNVRYELYDAGHKAVSYTHLTLPTKA